MLTEELQDRAGGDDRVVENGTVEKGWGAKPQDPPAMSVAEEVRIDWLDLRGTLAMLAADEGWSMGEVSRRCGIALGVLSPWYAGKYRGSYAETNNKVRRFLHADEERRSMAAAIIEPGFIRTPTAAEVLDALLVAQEMPGIAVIHLGAGMGKTSAIRHAVATRPHVYVITASPSVRTVPALNREIAARLEIERRHPGQLRGLIGNKLSSAGRNRLLVVDEAQNLGDDAVDELRHYRDEWQCGLALVGNYDVISRWGSKKPRDGYGQLHRRVTIRVDRLRPSPEDVAAFVDAWGIEDDDAVRLLTMIGNKPGALGQITETLKLAAIKARGARSRLTGEHIKWAWSRRADAGGIA